MFLDPYGMQVDWDTLAAIRQTEAIDVWYLFLLSGLYRQAARNLSAVDDSKAAITRMLGTDRWEAELYHETRQVDFLSGLENPVERQRKADVAGLEAYVKHRLGELFPFWKKPQTFSLFFATSNPSLKATNLAGKFAKHMVDREKKNSRRR